MPKVFNLNGFYCIVYTDDHDPPHVHIKYSGTTTILNLGASSEDVTIRDAQNMKPKDIKKAMELLEENWDDAVAKWEEYHGQIKRHDR